MKNLVSSQARLLDSRNIQLFKDLFICHGIPINRKISRIFTETERMEIVPLVFGLMPKSAIFRENDDQKIKPLIRENLISLGFNEIDEDLVTVIKDISDQYYFTSGKRPNRKKMSISDIRMRYRKDYFNLRSLQNNRCAICGIKLSDADEHLDHKIPFRLIGDKPGGINWQLLCSKCNIGKSSYISALQPSISQNWIYGLSIDEFESINNFDDTQWGLPVRYSILMQKKKCEFFGCNANPLSNQLILKINCKTALPVIDNFSVYCEDHI
jgi:hypothetical protein